VHLTPLAFLVNNSLRAFLACLNSIPSISFRPLPATELDRATFLGVVAAFGLVFAAIALGESATVFLDLKSALIVLGGTIGATLVNFPLDDFLKTFAVLRTAFYPDRFSAQLRMRKIMDIAEKVRTGSVLALQGEVEQEPDDFLRKCMELVLDGIQPDDIRRISEIELTFLSDRHRRGAQIFQSMGSVAPAMGLIGTVIGLIQMLKNLDNAAGIGPAMAVALVGTFYGSLLAYLVFLPLAGKLKARSQEETFIKELTVEGMVCIAKGVNPRILEEYLLGFLAPEKRVSRYR